MTREERNAKISELRTKGQPRINAGLGKVVDWHADANWPTLLREMRDDNPVLRFVEAPINAWVVYCWKRGEMVPAGIQMTNISLADCSRGDEPADAVCEAWLKWKSSAKIEATL